MTQPEPRPLDLRLLPLAAGVWGGTYLTLRVPSVILLGVFLFLVLAALAGYWRPRPRHSTGQRSVLALLCLLGLAVGILTTTGHVLSRGTALAQAAAADTKELIVQIEGTARLDPALSANPGWSTQPRYRLIVDVEQVCQRAHCQTSREVALVMGDATTVRAGMAISAIGRLRPTAPGAEESAQLSANSITITRPPSGIGAVTDRIRQAFREVTGQLSPSGAGLVPGISIGDRSALSAELSDAMKTASLTHLTAVSGAHVAVIVGAIVLLASRLGRWGSLTAGMATLSGIFLLVGPMPSIKRAMVMGLVVLLARLRGRAPAGMPALSLAVIVVICLWPHTAQSYGFALSVTATGGLILAVPVATRALARLLPEKLAAALAVPLAAQLACAPILALMLAQFQTYGVIANLLAAPAFIPALLTAVPAALIAPVAPGLSLFLAQLSAGFTWWLATVANWIASWPAARIELPEGVVAVGLVLLLSGIGIGLIRWLDRHGPTVRWRSPVRALITVGSVIVVLLVGYRWLPRSVPDWQAWQCDIGQGSAMLIRTGPDAALLLDTGEAGSGITNCLADAGVSELPVIFLSHPHADHVGALPEVLAAAQVGAISLGPGSHPAATIAAINRAAQEAGVPVYRPLGGEGAATGSKSSVGSKTGFGIGRSSAVYGPTVSGSKARPGNGREGQIGEVRWQILAPSSALIAESDTPKGVNDLSLVLLIEVPGLRILSLGDIELAGQRALAASLSKRCPAARCSDIDVVVVAHHGSSRQVERLAAIIGASVAVISAGEKNNYGHPAASAIEIYQRHGGEVFRTDRDGQLAINRTTAGIVVTKMNGS